ncbi:SDR family NAD(P)-dependent oxidoreductase [bacterium]|nr:SDR family NAD(P)-dependent oxidoreductase [bacterium]
MGLTIITGASSGIGRSLARRLAAAGDPVALIARRRPLLDSLVEEIERAGGQAMAIACDVTDRATVRAAVREAETRFGPTERLVANAGGALGSQPFSAEHVAAVVDLNLLGVANCIDAVLPGMLARRAGHLVAVSSLAASRGLPNSAAYSAAKAGLTNMMESLRIDLRPQGVDVTVLLPGFVRIKPGATRRKRNKPLRLELEPATRLMHRAIVARKPYYAFPASLAMLVGIARLLPAALYDRILSGRGPRPKAG